VEQIKEFIALGGSMAFPYKARLKEWFGEVKICSYRNSRTGNIVIEVSGPIEREEYGFDQIDVAVKRFIDLAIGDDNIGRKQQLAMKSIPIEEVHMLSDDMEVIGRKMVELGLITEDRLKFELESKEDEDD
jgi:uncharacterized protein YkuJ